MPRFFLCPSGGCLQLHAIVVKGLVYQVIGRFALLLQIVGLQKRPREIRQFARHGAPVSTPLHWDELAGRMKTSNFHVGNVARRMNGLRPDPWKAFYRTAQTLTAAMKRKLGILQ